MGMRGAGQTGRKYRERFGAAHRACPYCDLELIGNISNSEIDHFLPKARHPVLATHGRNLIVSCKACSTGEKASTPIGYEDGMASHLPIFHPLLEQPADHLRCWFDVDATKVRLRPTAPPGSLTAVKARHWVQVFGLERQFGARLPSIRDLRKRLRDRVRVTYRYVAQSGGTPVLDDLFDLEVETLEVHWQEVRGQEPGAKLVLDFLHHLKTTWRMGELEFIRSLL